MSKANLYKLSDPNGRYEKMREFRHDEFRKQTAIKKSKPKKGTNAKRSNGSSRHS